MGNIKILDKSSILRLAAGEIIDRPLSIVKELVENSIDANAKQIVISLQQGGIAEILISDDGDGILNEDIQKTIISHATSKLTSFDDLQSVRTMGFRGEALASISEVADLSIHSYNMSDKIGVELLKKATSDELRVSKLAREKGTTIKVSHLFKHIPVRYKFLKSASSEATAVCKCIQQLSLHHPNISFRLFNNGNELLNTFGEGDLIAQFRQVLQLKESFQLIPFQKETGQIRVSGVIAEPTVTYKNRAKCWFSVNNRMVQAAVFFKAIQQALQDVIPKQTFPAIICNIECPTEDVDINMHPKKEEVKFAFPDQIFIAVKRAVQSGIHQKSAAWQASKLEMNSNSVDFNVIPKLASESDFNVFQKESLISKNDPKENESFVQLDKLNKKWSTDIEQGKKESESFAGNFREQSEIRVRKYEEKKEHVVQNQLIKTSQELKWVAFKNKFILLPLKDDVFIFDQHAVHERILYDEFKKQQLSQSFVIMPLLVPEYIKCSSEEHHQIKEFIPTFNEIGVDIKEFDNELFIIREIPQALQKVNIGNWVKEILHEPNAKALLNENSEELIQQLQLKACKAAVKAGQRLTDQEVSALIEKCIESETQFTCPHGRPLYIKLSENKLDSLFLRS